MDALTFLQSDFLSRPFNSPSNSKKSFLTCQEIKKTTILICTAKNRGLTSTCQLEELHTLVWFSEEKIN